VEIPTSSRQVHLGHGVRSVGKLCGDLKGLQDDELVQSARFMTATLMEIV
jgi:hypothetical protein